MNTVDYSKRPNGKIGTVCRGWIVFITVNFSAKEDFFVKEEEIRISDNTSKIV